MDVIRTEYLEALNQFRDDTDVVKVIQGVRRCGKSTLMVQFIDVLKNSGVGAKDIFHANFESSDLDDVRDGDDLKALIKKSIGRDRRTYILLDEVQRVNGWETAVNSFLADYNADIYVTGSNAYLLSSELSTFLAGRYVSIRMLPLSFREFTELHTEKTDDIRKMFSLYVRYGGFPAVDPFEPESKISARIGALYDSVVYKDIILRGGIRNAGELERVVRYLMMNIGNPISAGNIAESLKGIDRRTVEKYIELLEESYIIYRADRYDLKSTVLSPSPKYYVVDTGLRNVPLRYVREDYGRLLENIVFLELIRRGFSVTVGRYNDTEIDFTARRNDTIVYFQVTASIDRVADRELRPLRSLKDNHVKIVVSDDPATADFEDGIRHIGVIDLLLGEW